MQNKKTMKTVQKFIMAINMTDIFCDFFSRQINFFNFFLVKINGRNSFSILFF